MNIQITGVILLNHRRITRISNVHPHCRNTVISRNFYQIHDEKCSFLSFSTTRVKTYHMKPDYFGQCLCCINIDKNNYLEETELDTNPSLTLARTLTLSIGECNFGNFTSSLVTTPWFLILSIWIHQKIWGGIQRLDQKPIWDEKSQLHEIDA